MINLFAILYDPKFFASDPALAPGNQPAGAAALRPGRLRDDRKVSRAEARAQHGMQVDFSAGGEWPQVLQTHPPRVLTTPLETLVLRRWRERGFAARNTHQLSGRNLQGWPPRAVIIRSILSA